MQTFSLQELFAQHTWCRCLTYGRDVVSYCCLRLCNLCKSPWLTSSGVLWNVCSVAYLLFLVTSKIALLVFGLTLSIAISCYKIRAIVASAKSRNVFVMTIHSEQQFFEGKVAVMWNFNGKSRSITSKIRILELVVSLIECQRSYSRGSLGAPEGN